MKKQQVCLVLIAVFVILCSVQNVNGNQITFNEYFKGKKKLKAYIIGDLKFMCPKGQRRVDDECKKIWSIKATKK